MTVVTFLSLRAGIVSASEGYVTEHPEIESPATALSQNLCDLLCAFRESLKYLRWVGIIYSGASQSTLTMHCMYKIFCRHTQECHDDFTQSHCYISILKAPRKTSLKNLFHFV